MNNFFKRLLTAIVFTGTLLGCLLYGAWTFFGLVLLLTGFTLREFYTIISTDKIKPQVLVGIAGGWCVVFTSGLVFMGQLESFWLFINLPVIFMVFVYELYTKSEKPFVNIAMTVFGIFYIAVPYSMLLLIPYQSGDGHTYFPQLVFGYFLLLWAYDTGAYLSGMAFGKHRLFKRISPKKSWEGTIGGTLLNIFTAWCCSVWFPDLNHFHWTVVGLIIVVTGTFGDLAESLLKRSLQIKDSGTLLPGHGGLLDRFDALLVSVPFVVTYLVIIRNLFPG